MGMARVRWWMTTVALPLAYAALVYQATRPPKATYVFAKHTVMTVTDKGGPAILHGPDVVYPAQALRDRVEGTVSLKVEIASDGTVARAAAISGPEPLRQAAVDDVRQWQFDAKAQETQIDVGFSLRSVTRTLVLPEAVRRTTPVNRSKTHGSVRVVAVVDSRGRVEFVHPVTGPGDLVPAALDSVRHWTFRPALRNGQPVQSTAVVDVPFGL